MTFIKETHTIIKDLSTLANPIFEIRMAQVFHVKVINYLTTKRKKTDISPRTQENKAKPQ